jgi:hypothetical protein
VEAVDVSERDDDLVEVRMLVPRAALVQAAPAPELVSQATSLGTFGVPARRFLEIVRRADFPGRVIRNGKLRLVRPADFIAALERIDATEEQGPRPTAEAESAPTRRSSIAEELGLEEAPRARRRAG